jgi:hypothetical protein
MIDALTAFFVLGVFSLLVDETTRRKPTKHQYKAFRAPADQREQHLQYAPKKEEKPAPRQRFALSKCRPVVACEPFRAGNNGTT